MLYQFLKLWVWLGLKIFCRKIIIAKTAALKTKGPLLIACNHPNSFLDAIILDVLFNNPVISLARGDAFLNPFVTKVLKALYMLPVYRTSEGKHNVPANYQTFNECQEVFNQNGIVLIFSEGRCVNEWHLRPLMKGTARLTLSSWDKAIPLKVLPVGINYSSFKRFGKNVFLHFGELITERNIDRQATEGLQIKELNQQLTQQLQQLVYEIKETDKETQTQQLTIIQNGFKKFILGLPALVGLLVHTPLFIIVNAQAKNIDKKNGHYDSILAGLLIFVYPFFLLFVSFATYYITSCNLAWLLIIILPFCAWSYVQIKPKQL